MKARDVMVFPVITVKPSASIREAAALMLERHISALPVVDAQDRLVGMLSEGDLIRRVETGTERRRSWWLRLFTSEAGEAAEYAKTHARRVEDVMTRNVIGAGPDTPLHEVATLLEKHAIKRVPILQDGHLVGILSRANLVQALATARQGEEVHATDSEIRERILAELRGQPWADTSLMNVTVKDGVVELWGLIRSEPEKRAMRVAAESVAGVRAVNNHLVVRAIEVSS
jgi:CBS domain-containing protein